MNIDEHVRLATLLDIYGGLLTERQRAIMSQYLYEDCSLFEIAEREGISKQGVFDTIKNAEGKFLKVDEALGLTNRLAHTRAVISGLKSSELSSERAALELEDIWKFDQEGE